MLHGLNWLVVRQHRASILAVLAMIVLGSIWIVHYRGQMHDLLTAAGWPDKPLAAGEVYPPGYDYAVNALSVLPVVLAVFVGAPLISADQENGTAQLVTTQSVSRRRWLTSKLFWSYLLVIVCATVISAFFTWWWKPYHDLMPHQWFDGPVFDNTGPMLPAFCLFLTAAGITIGLLVRRVLMSMVVTFVFAVAVETVWSPLRQFLGSPRMTSYPLDAEAPSKLDNTWELDRWISDSDGRLFGWGHCTTKMPTEAAHDACIKENGIVDNVVKYLGYDQMSAMQWTGAGFLLLATVALTAFTLWRASRRPL
ncbi:ABC transporter permease [Streptomyces sp. NPDC059802]|uniref:ABC transporter permease n=1 Tax=Streptomyces sp. NPDC059802 TaxID=3346952 RepID=UPI00364E5FC9